MRDIIKNHSYAIPLREKWFFMTQRVFVLGYFFLRYKLRRLIATEFKSATDIFKKYFSEFELPRIRGILGLNEDDTISAVKLLTYIHSLSGCTGEIIEMTHERSVRIETHCPASKLFSRNFCENIMSQPTFQHLCRCINPDMTHLHTTFLSGGEDRCTMIFEITDDTLSK